MVYCIIRISSSIHPSTPRSRRTIKSNCIVNLASARQAVGVVHCTILWANVDDDNDDDDWDRE